MSECGGGGHLGVTLRGVRMIDGLFAFCEGIDCT
jgi:hypothetical protein